MYLGLCVNNNDPERRGRVQVFVPHITPALYDGWNKEGNDINITCVGSNLQNGLTDEQIRTGSEDVLAAVKQHAEGKVGSVDIPKVFNNGQEAFIVKQKRTITPFKNPNAIQLAAELGGLKDGADLKAMDAHKVFVPGRGRLVRENGMELDAFGQKLADRKFNGYHDENVPDANEVKEIIRNAINGKHIYAEENRAEMERTADKKQQLAYENDIQRIYHAGLSNYTFEQ
jgi:hypothetical protein